MSAIRAYAMWKIKEDIELNNENITYFSPGGFSFTHKSGQEIYYDFEESCGHIINEDNLIDFSLKNIDNDFITGDLKSRNLKELIQEQYDIDFFKDGKFDIQNNEVHCCMDLKIGEEIQEEVDYTKYIDLVYLSIFDPYNTDEIVIFYNSLTEEEYNKHFE